jgi:II/X family phage/plasmid replication protein
MIDWVTAILPCDHDPSKLISGIVMSFNAAGEQEWVSNKTLSVEGSHSAMIQVKSHTDTQILVHGNPAKFLQGHNIFGTDDLVYLMGRFFDALLKHDQLGLCPTADQYEYIQSGSYHLTRVDFNLSWHLDNKEAVLSWIRAAANCANLKYRGAGQFTGDTLYFGKHSRYWSLKCYSKGHEITAKDHRLPKELQIPELILWANKSLRLELVLRSMYLKSMMLDVAQNWTKDTGKELLLSCIRDDLQISDNMAIKDDVIQSLPSKLRLVYSAWSHGTDIRTIYSKAQFYKYRKQLLAYGIDISVIHDSNRSNVIPLVRYLEAVPASIPDWAYEKGLVA